MKTLILIIGLILVSTAVYAEQRWYRLSDGKEVSDPHFVQAEDETPQNPSEAIIYKDYYRHQKETAKYPDPNSPGGINNPNVIRGRDGKTKAFVEPQYPGPGTYIGRKPGELPKFDWKRD